MFSFGFIIQHFTILKNCYVQALIIHLTVKETEQFSILMTEYLKSPLTFKVKTEFNLSSKLFYSYITGYMPLKLNISTTMLSLIQAKPFQFHNNTTHT